MILVNISSIDGIKEVESSMEEGIPEVQIRVDRTRASQYGLTAAQIASSVRGNISGIRATQFKYEGDEIDVVISGDDTITQSISNLEQMMIPTAAGFNVPLSQVAEVVIDRGPVTIIEKDRFVWQLYQLRYLIGFGKYFK